MNVAPVYNVFNQNRYNLANNAKKPVSTPPVASSTSFRDKITPIISIGAIAAAIIFFGTDAYKTLKTSSSIKKAAKLAEGEAQSLVLEGKKLYDDMLAAAKIGASNNYLNIIDETSIMTTFDRLKPAEDGSVSTIIKQINTKTGLSARCALLKDDKLLQASVFDTFGARRTDYFFDNSKLSSVDRGVIDFQALGATIEKRFVFDDNENLSIFYKGAKKLSGAIESSKEAFIFEDKKPTLFQKGLSIKNDKVDAKESYVKNRFGTFKKVVEEISLDDPRFQAISDFVEDITTTITDAIFDY